MQNKLHIAALSLLLIAANPVSAQYVSDVTNTKHNLSISSPGSTKATSESQICVFCHTPHAAEKIPNAPLWNRKVSTATYTPYTSSSIDANDIAATPGGSSKLCLSCHDGTIAIGSVNVANGQANVSISMTGTETNGTMPAGSFGATSGFTRRLGTDLSNDHPISFTYSSELAALDGELRDPATVDHIANRVPGLKPEVPLEDNQMQCTSCHDPHIRDVDLSKNRKFLRLNRFQEGTPAGGAFDPANDIVCLACHDKLGQAWSTSAHADPTVANETYSASAAALREFPANQPVWKASCLNCHDTHTVQGARRLLREGTDSTATPKTGGNAAQEEACYTCHSADGGVLNGQGSVNFEVPNIKTDFSTSGNTHMPITNADQNTASEIHDINNADLMETQANLGISNRHVECTDCHNPHRVTKNQLFNATGSTIAGTHRHASGHTNIASGVLRGSWGVEPSYAGPEFNPTNLPLLYTVKSGDGGIGASTDVTANHVTREYQICFKCHSDYSYGSNPPLRGSTGGNTPTNQANGLSRYTNQAMEFQAPAGHEAEGTSLTPTGADRSTNNHRSWHPVMKPTGRTLTEKRTATSNNWLSPFNGAANIGNQTMYCSDCHGSDTANGTAVPRGGENGNPWGPHGSSNKYILKGDWSSNTGNDRDDICFKCHNYDFYANDSDRGNNGTGFCCGGGRGNLHAYHANQFPDRNKTLRCMWCHIAVPHGWKNKALLVNLNDVGPEVGLAPGTEVLSPDGGGYTNGPYYVNAQLKVLNFANSGQWNDTNCGSDGRDGTTGKDWMQDTCKNPP